MYFVNDAVAKKSMVLGHIQAQMHRVYDSFAIQNSCKRSFFGSHLLHVNGTGRHGYE